jgi:hypothetical protein
MRVALSEAAFEAIRSTPREGRAGEVHRSVTGKYHVWLERDFIAKLEGMRQPNEPLSAVILKVTALQAAPSRR